jgi:hypothetical protein
MAILDINTSETIGLVGVSPQFIYIRTNNTSAEVTTAGYADSAKAQGFEFDDEQMALITTTDDGVGLYQVNISNTGVVTFEDTNGSSGVALPTKVNYIASFLDVLGQIGDNDGPTILHEGSIQAGANSTAGTFISYPGVASKGTLILSATANTGNTNVTITNAVMGQATVMTIPDPGTTSSSFLLTNSSGIQTIATGSLAVTHGNISAGSTTGVLGALFSFPSTALRGSLVLSATANTGNFLTVISNQPMGQQSTISIPDPGQSTADFVITSVVGGNNATQHITSGSLQTDNGFMYAGSDGNAGEFISFPTTIGRGQLSLKASDNTGLFHLDITNDPFTISSTIKIPAIPNANGKFLVSAGTTPFVDGNIPKASGTGGLMIDSGFSASNIQDKTNIKIATTSNIGGGGAGPITVSVTGLTTSSVVVPVIASSTNAVSVSKCIAGTGNFQITFSADPGASCFVNYFAGISAQ